MTSAVTEFDTERDISCHRKRQATEGNIHPCERGGIHHGGAVGNYVPHEEPAGEVGEDVPHEGPVGDVEEACWVHDKVQDATADNDAPDRDPADAPWPGAGAGKAADGATDGGDASDKGSLGVCVNSRDWCSWCRGHLCSCTGKPICYSWHDRYLQCKQRFYSASGNPACVRCQEAPVDALDEDVPEGGFTGAVFDDAPDGDPAAAPWPCAEVDA